MRGRVLDLFPVIGHNEILYSYQGEVTSALRTKEKAAKNRHPQTQKKAAEKQTQEQIKNHK
jgi:hypothetical protein